MLMACQLHMLHDTGHVSSCVGSRGLQDSRGQMDPDIHLERLAMLSLEDNKKVDAQKEKDDKPHHQKWHRIPREVNETKESQHDQNDEEDHKRMRPWADEGKTNPYQQSGKWPRWRQWNPNKGPYRREKEKKKANTAEGSTSSSSGTARTTTTTTTDADVYWDSEGRWHLWWGGWWKQDESGWWEKWQQPLQQ